MTGPYTPTQFHPRELREENVPLDFYDKSWEIRGSNHSGGRRRALTKRDHADGYVRVGDPEFPGPEFQAWKKSIVNDLHPVLGQLNSCYQPGAVPMCIFPMVVDDPASFFNQEGSNNFSPIWRESLAQVANLAATYGIFRVFQPRDIARVRAFLDFWGGESRSSHADPPGVAYQVTNMETLINMETTQVYLIHYRMCSTTLSTLTEKAIAHFSRRAGLSRSSTPWPLP
mmetsp:Transcript_4869/g.8292  ORF Transcript_4869/g.8292 Transcript_4869/m.8292 type:complete len:228 (+) Transcript_4869:1-684(+)